MTIKYFLKSETIIPSKGNSLSLLEVDFMFPHKEEIPLYPVGIIWIPTRNVFRASKNIAGKKIHIAESKDVTVVINALWDFCEKHHIKP